MACKSCDQEDKIIVPVSTSCIKVDTEFGSCQSSSGKFHDKTIREFTVPKVGKIGSLDVCQAKLWAASQFIGVCVGKSKYAFFRIVETGEHTLKVLNGCERGNPDSGISGNPEPGTILPEGSVLFPCPPVGCSDQLTEQFAELLSNNGVDGVIRILKESDEICFTATPEVATEEVAHLFGGTFIDCDCAPEPSLFQSCLRKILNIFTGQSGKTLCFPEVGSTSDDDVIVDGEPVSKYLAYFDEKGCLKKGRKAKAETEEDIVTSQALLYFTSTSGAANATLPKTVYAINNVPSWARHVILACQVDGTLTSTPRYDFRLYAYYGVGQNLAIAILGEHVYGPDNFLEYSTAIVPLINGTIALSSSASLSGGGSVTTSLDTRVVGFL